MTRYIRSRLRDIRDVIHTATGWVTSARWAYLAHTVRQTESIEDSEGEPPAVRITFCHHDHLTTLGQEHLRGISATTIPYCGGGRDHIAATQIP